MSQVQDLVSQADTLVAGAKGQEWSKAVSMYEQAASLLQQALAQLEGTIPANSLELVPVLRRLRVALKNHGRREESCRQGDREVAILRANGNKDQAVIVLAELAEICQQYGDYRGAQGYRAQITNIHRGG